MTTLRKLALVALLIALVSVAGDAQAPITSKPKVYDPSGWMSGDRTTPLQIHRYYKTQYNQVIYVADVSYLVDGTPVFVVENVVGKLCANGRSCTLGADATTRQQLGWIWQVDVTWSPALNQPSTF